MKKLIFLGALFMGVWFTNCGDACDDVNCGANGTCVEGDCQCDDGYIGTLCDTENRAKFIGTWTSDAWICDGDTEMGTVVISNGSTINELTVTNPDAGFSLSGTVSGDSFNIPAQVIDIMGAAVTVDGSGSLAGGTLTFSVKGETLGITVISCAGMFTK